MIQEDFIAPKYDISILQNGSVTWKSPSNIALVKYWGKTNPQLPKNPSISFTLDNCYTQTTVDFQQVPSSDIIEFDIFFEGEKKESFRPKITSFFKRIVSYVPFLASYKLRIESTNSFPHSSGIASSASGMAALALCVMSIEKLLNSDMSEEYFKTKASFLARLGSGSACRSIDGGLVVWGKHHLIDNSSDLYGIPFTQEVHPIFKDYNDTILLVDKGEKKVSSTVGHELMYQHPFAEQRFVQANDHIEKLAQVLIKGDVLAFIKIVESEALSLHAMMMTSYPYFILMKPHTLEIIDCIWAFREETDIPVCFTLDAGANVHVLYPNSYKKEVNNFIKVKLSPFCQNHHYICDHVGKGSSQIKK